MKTAFIFLADGFEDIEALGTRDVLVRAGIDTRLVSISDEPFVCSAHGITVSVDCLLEDVSQIERSDVMVFPGGLPGAQNLSDCRPLVEAMRAHYAEGGVVAAICAAPGLVLTQLPTLEGLKMTCYDGFEGRITAKGGEFVAEPALRSGNVITGRGPGHCLDFGFEIASALAGADVVDAVRNGMILTCE